MLPLVQLRSLVPGDYDAALQLWHATPGVRGMETRPEFERILARNPGLGTVATAGDELVGAVLCTHDGRRGYLYHLAVKETFRRQGLGGRIVARCLEQLRTEGIRRCTIFLIADNEEGAVFWKNCGWRVRTDLTTMAIDLD